MQSSGRREPDPRHDATALDDDRQRARAGVALLLRGKGGSAAHSVAPLCDIRAAGGFGLAWRGAEPVQAALLVR